MHVRNATFLLKSTPGYVCIPCRLQYARLRHRSFERFQHTDTRSLTEPQNATNLLSFSDRIRHFLSENPIIEEQDKASIVTHGNECEAQTPKLDGSASRRTVKRRRDEEIEKVLIEEFFARTENLEPAATKLENNTNFQEELKKVTSEEAIRARSKLRRRLEARARLEKKFAKKSAIKSKATAEEIPKREHNAPRQRSDGDQSGSQGYNFEASQVTPDTDTKAIPGSASTADTKHEKNDSSNGGRAMPKSSKAKAKKAKATVGTSVIQKLEELEDPPKKAAESNKPKDTAKITKKKSRVAKAEAEAPNRDQRRQALAKQRLLDKMTSKIAALQADLKKKASKDQLRRLSKDHAVLLRRKKALVRSDTKHATEDKKHIVTKNIEQDALMSGDRTDKTISGKEDPVLKAVKKTTAKRSPKAQPSQSASTKTKPKKVRSEIHKADAFELKIQRKIFQFPR